MAHRQQEIEGRKVNSVDDSALFDGVSVICRAEQSGAENAIKTPHESVSTPRRMHRPLAVVSNS